jgi:hypothetical protein
MNTELRTAVSYRTWDTGERSTHYWIEVEPDLWLEVDDLGTPEAQAEFRSEHPPIDKPIPGKSYAIRAHTSYLRQFSDAINFSSK